MDLSILGGSVTALLVVSSNDLSLLGGPVTAFLVVSSMGLSLLRGSVAVSCCNELQLIQFWCEIVFLNEPLSKLLLVLTGKTNNGFFGNNACKTVY